MRAPAILLVVACAGRADADCDLSTDAGLDAAYKAATGKKLPTNENRCVNRSTTFPGIVRIGSFANDRGCRWSDVLVGCKLNPSGYAVGAMAKAGWAKADAAKRQTLAVAWLREIDDIAVIEAIDGLPKTPKVTPLVATPARDGTLRLEGWVQAPSGMQRGITYTKIRVTFAADGTHGTVETIDSVFVDP